MSARLRSHKPVRLRSHNASGKTGKIVKVQFDKHIWARWLNEHNERMRNPAVALREKP